MTYPYKARITGPHSIEINEMTDEEIERCKEQRRLKRIAEEEDCDKQLYFDFMKETTP